ncbi:MAG: cupin domain-containing protein [Sulfitobacter sp.]
MPERAQAIATQLVKDERVVVTRYEFQPGAETGWHEHGMDYVIVALTDCQMLIEGMNGTQSVEIARGDAYSRQAGVKHNVVNDGQGPMSFVETELVKPQS